jgi:hypothetical protein
MNPSQRIVLILAFLAILGMALFPPWTFIYDEPEAKRVERPAGYHLIFGQYAPENLDQLKAQFGLRPDYHTALQFFSIRIDGTRLFVQISTTMVLTSILYLALRRKPSD